jgi:CDP-2,3-bis-(O-geranylgeranyl)-sn-glycerol synthase
MILELILKSLYFFLPAYLANMAPVLVKKIPFLERAVSVKYFGENKTWRGLVVATIAGGLVFIIQQMFYNSGFKSLALIDYSGFSIFMGFYMGAGAILGDLVKSYYKRKADIPAGKPWPVFDQIDFVIGGIFGASFFYVAQGEVFLILLVFSPLLHVIVNYLGYVLKIKKNIF